jgi:hypothetical protein
VKSSKFTWFSQKPLGFLKTEWFFRNMSNSLENRWGPFPNTISHVRSRVFRLRSTFLSPLHQDLAMDGFPFLSPLHKWFLISFLFWETQYKHKYSYTYDHSLIRLQQNKKLLHRWTPPPLHQAIYKIVLVYLHRAPNLDLWWMGTIPWGGSRHPYSNGGSSHNWRTNEEPDGRPLRMQQGCSPQAMIRGCNAIWTSLQN